MTVDLSGIRNSCFEQHLKRHKCGNNPWQILARRPSTDKLVLGSPRTALPRTIALMSFARITVVHDGNPYQANSMTAAELDITQIAGWIRQKQCKGLQAILWLPARTTAL